MKKTTNTYFWNMFFLVTEWTCIFLTIVAARNSSFWMWIPAWIIIGTRQHALGVLMHEASHFGLLPKRKWNDLVGDAFLALPGLMTVQSYRHSHLQHHRNNQSEVDPTYTRKISLPEYQFPQTRSEFSVNILKKLTGWGFVEVLLRVNTLDKSAPKKRGLGLFIISLFAAFSIFGLWKEFLVFWMIPAATILPTLLYLRAVSEHLGLPTKPGTRTVEVDLLGKFFLYPYNVNYHVEHHIMPALSWQQLPEVRSESELQSSEHHAHIQGVRSFISSLVTK